MPVTLSSSVSVAPAASAARLSARRAVAAPLRVAAVRAAPARVAFAARAQAAHAKAAAPAVSEELLMKSINAIRFLAIDGVEKANSGHPGLPMGCAPMTYVLFRETMKFNPKNPQWFNRDRFVLSAGHGSMLQYAMLHLCGYDSVTVGGVWGSGFADAARATPPRRALALACAACPPPVRAGSDALWPALCACRCLRPAAQGPAELPPVGVQDAGPPGELRDPGRGGDHRCVPAGAAARAEAARARALTRASPMCGSGPLGQGVCNAVGLALAEKHLAARFNKPDAKIVDHYTCAPDARALRRLLRCSKGFRHSARPRAPRASRPGVPRGARAAASPLAAARTPPGGCRGRAGRGSSKAGWRPYLARSARAAPRASAPALLPQASAARARLARLAPPASPASPASRQR
jgi:hypothetical protein